MSLEHAIGGVPARSPRVGVTWGIAAVLAFLLPIALCVGYFFPNWFMPESSGLDRDWADAVARACNPYVTVIDAFQRDHGTAPRSLSDVSVPIHLAQPLADRWIVSLSDRPTGAITGLSPNPVEARYLRTSQTQYVIIVIYADTRMGCHALLVSSDVAVPWHVPSDVRIQIGEKWIAVLSAHKVPGIMAAVARAAD